MKISSQINCGIDLIGVSVSDGILGFTTFLEAYNGSFAKKTSLTDWITVFTFNINGLNLEGKYNRGSKRLTLMIGALTQYSDTSKAYGRWSLLQMLYRHYSSSLYVNELHLAVDIPYAYCDVHIKPENCVYQPSFLSTKYFDTRRGKGKVLRSNDNFVIYDKCRKCRIGTPLTRIELRFKINNNTDIFEDSSMQYLLAKKIDRKFKAIKIQKGRSNIRLTSCDWGQALATAMHFVVDSNQHMSVLMHRNEDVWQTGEVFKDFMKFCAKHNIYTAKPQNHAKAKEFLTTLRPQERQMLGATIMSYNKYDKKWYQDPRFNMSTGKPKQTRLTNKIRDEILFMLEQGQTQASIADELNVSKSTISRWLYRYVKLKDSIFMLW